ncbi:MAG: hypothetical protein CL417_05380 [Acidimicrobiaceae bacterium]|nr:hypothetical protein [Acidimicrobiaceae bacterium]|tara:strand:+ start:123 stop:413 length:291 start_codon:yes stop_codon:yes gene_type:complete
MKFIQIMEFNGSPEDADQALKQYIEKADGRSYARKATICVDRDNPETLIQLIEFDSWEEAQKNNELEMTNDDHEETQDSFGEITFRNLDVFAEYNV